MSTATSPRRPFLCVLAFFLAAAMFAGCGSKKDDDDGEEETKPNKTQVRKDPDNAVETFTNARDAFLAAKAKKAADFIRERYTENPAVAFLISEESYNNADSDDRFVLEEMRKRLNRKGISCDKVITLKMSESEGGISSAKLNKVLGEVKDNVNILVNFIGLPESTSGIASVNFLKETGASAGRNDMLLMCDIGLPFVRQSMIKNNHISAIIEYLSAEGNNFDVMNDKPPKDLDKAFDYFYFFVNANTLADFNAKENDLYFIP